MRKLILHIGSHKTGSTSLQIALKKSDRTGGLSQWTYVRSRAQANFSHAVRIAGEGADMRAFIKPNYLRTYIPTEGDCLISTEMMFWLDNAREVKKLSDILHSIFDKIKIIVYLRRQVDLALSHRKQVIVGNPAQKFYGIQVRALPIYRTHMLRYFDYASKISMWEDAFGKSNVIVRRYQKQDLLDGNVVSDFYNIINVARLKNAQHGNPAWPRSHLLTGLYLASKGFKEESIKEVVKSLPNDGWLLPSQAEAREFMRPFRASNAELARRYDSTGIVSYFSDDFDMFPERSNDDISDILPLIERVVASRCL